MNENEYENVQQAADAIAAAEFVWGSCQYDGAAKLYAKLCKEEEERNRDEVIKKLGIEVGKVQPFEGDILVGFKEALFINLSEWEADGEDMTCLRVQLEEASDVTDALQFLGDWSWDLWSAVPYIAAVVFPELNMDNAPDAPGFGPVLNIMAQNSNNRVGVTCWLLKSYGFVEDDEPFKDWDT